MRIAAVVPAAGLSRRMGAFKPLLPLGGKPVIAHTVGCLQAAGVHDICVVTGYQAKALEGALSGLPVRLAHNARYFETGMLESIQVGLLALPPFDAVFLLPGDMPAVHPHTFTLLIRAQAATGAGVVRPAYLGRHGHPPLLTPRVTRHLLAFRGKGGLRAALSPYARSAHTVETGDPGCLLDLDTPEDMQTLLTVFKKSLPPEASIRR